MTRRGFEDYDRFQAEVLSCLVKQGIDASTTIAAAPREEDRDDDFQPLWSEVSAFDN